MTIGEHLEELRSRLIFSILGFIVAAIVCLSFGQKIVVFFCRPLIDGLMKKNLNPQLFYTEISGGFMVYMKVSLICAVAMAGPWMLSVMLEVMSEDYIRTARSKGLPENRVIIRHALWNALIPVVTLIGIEMGYLLGGTFIVEQLFALPGLGRLLVNAISQREYALVQGSVLFIALNFVIINLIVDLIYSVIDPRISYGN